MFLWNHQREFCIVNSRYGRAFAISPFGAGVRAVPRTQSAGIPRGLDEIDLELKSRLTANTDKIREAIRGFLDSGKIKEARTAILNFYWLKLGRMNCYLTGFNTEKMKQEELLKEELIQKDLRIGKP